MFDDPKKHLRQMEEALRAAEYEDMEPVEEEEDWLAEAKALLGDEEEPELPIRNRANNYGRSPQNRAVDFNRTVFEEEVFDQDAALCPPKKKEKGIGGLLFLAVLELIGIGAVVLWWLRWLGWI